MSLLLLTTSEIFLKKKVASNIIPLKKQNKTNHNSPASTASARCARGSHRCVRIG